MRSLIESSQLITKLYLLMNDNKKLGMDTSGNSELPFVQTCKSDGNYSKKNQQKMKATNRLHQNESERIRKQYNKVCKQLKQTYGIVKKSTTNLIDIKKLVIKENGDDKPICTFERTPSRRKNTTQPQQQQSQQLNPFSTAFQVMSLSPQRRQFVFSNNNNIRLNKRLKPLSHFLMKRLQTDYLSIEKIKIDSKRIGMARDVNVMIGIRSDSKMSKQREEKKKNPQKQTPQRIISKIRQKCRNHTYKSSNYNSSYKIKPNSNAPKKQRIFVVPFETYYYRDLIWKINFSNSMIVETPVEYEHRLRVYIGKGNNSGLIRGLIKRRLWCAITEKVQDANFVWTQLKVLSYFQLQKGQDQQKLSQGDKYLENGLFTQEQSQNLKNYFANNLNIQERTDERFNHRLKLFKSKVKKIIRTKEIRQNKMHNHLINNYVIGNKKALLKAMTIYYKKTDDFVFNHLPYTFHIAQGLEDENYFRFLRYYYQKNKQIKASNEAQKQQNMWIVKPGQNSNRGYGIKVCKTLQQIKSIIKQKQKCADGTNRTYIVQEYIEKPLLYNKRKFDLRHYMMITCVNGILKGYWYREGYVRTSSTQYTLKVKDGRVHLTNDAVQKQMPDYGKYEKGNKISYDELHNYLSRLYGYKNYNFKDVILPKMKKTTTDLIRACSGSIDPQFKGHNFEIFGLDFMIDSQFNLWLIEVNTNPCLEISCPLLSGIIPKMIENALQITLDSLFPPPVRYTPKGIHYYKKLEEENKFDLIYDSRLEGTFGGESNGIIDERLLEDEDETFQDDGSEWAQD